MKFWTIVVFVVFGLSSCESLFEPTGPGKVTIDYELPKLQEGQSSPTDKSLKYRPGVVSKVAPEDVETEPKTGAMFVKDEYVVVLKPNKSDKDLARDLRVAGIDAKLIGYLPTVGLVQVHCEGLDEKKKATMQKLASVKNVEVHYIKESNQSSFKSSQKEINQWPIYKFGIPSLWAVSKGGGQTIAIVDTGLDLSIAELKNRIVEPYSIVTRSKDFEDRQYTVNKSVLRVVDHGTTVAFVAAGTEDPNQKASGIAPEAKIMPIQVFGYSLYRDKIVTNDLMVIEGILRSIAYGASIINLSLGIDYSSIVSKIKDPAKRSEMIQEMLAISDSARTVYSRALAEANARGILVVVAGGNDGMHDENIQPLSGGEGVITAGSIDSNGVISSFSNTGDFIDCYAPGEKVFSITTGENLVSRSGTSYSAPYVAGVLAIMRSYDPKLTPKQLKTALKKTNFSFRSSILDVNEKPLFSPSRLMSELNPKFEIDDKQVKDFFKFEKLYSKFFVSKADKDLVVYDKITGYYATKGDFNQNDAEWIRGIQIAKKNAGVIIPNIKMDMKSYFSAELINDAKISKSELDLAADHILDSDYFSFVLRDSNYAQLAKVCEKRLRELPLDFNLNTLDAFDSSAPKSTRVEVLKLMAGAISSQKSTRLATFSPVLFYWAKALESAESNDITTIKTYCGAYFKYLIRSDTYHDNRTARFMIDAGLQVRYEPALKTCFDYILYLEKLIADAKASNDPSLIDTLSEDELALRQFADRLNAVLPSEIAYYPYDSLEEKQKRLPLITAFLDSFVFK